MTGRVVTAAEAEAWGLVARVVPHERLLDEADRGARGVLPHRARRPAST